MTGKCLHTQGSSREESRVARKAERGGVFIQSSLDIACFEWWTLPVKNKQRLPKKTYRWAMVTSKDAHVLSHVWLCDTMSPGGSSVHGIFQVRILEWVAISFSTVSSWPRDWTCVSCVSYIEGVFFIRWAYFIPPYFSFILPYSVLFAMLCGLWDLSFPTRDETHAFGNENRVLTTEELGIPRKFSILNWTIQWIFLYSQGCGNHHLHLVPKHFLHPKRKPCAQWAVGLIPTPPHQAPGNNWPTSCGSACSGHFLSMESHTVWPFVSGFFLWASCSLGSSTLSQVCQRPVPFYGWMLGKTKAKREEGRQRWDGLIASPTQWTWTWANSRR